MVIGIRDVNAAKDIYRNVARITEMPRLLEGGPYAFEAVGGFLLCGGDGGQQEEQ